MEKEPIIDFDNLASVSNTNNKQNASDPMSVYLKINKLNTIHEYNLAYSRLIKTLKPIKILRAYYLNYYLACLYQKIFPFFLYTSMLFANLFLLLSNLSFTHKLYGIILISLVYTGAYIYSVKLKDLDITFSDIINNKLLYPILFLSKKRTNLFYIFSEKAIKKLRSPQYIHVLALLKDYKEREPVSTKNLGLFDICDFDTFLQAVSSNNKSYLMECFLKFAIYLKECGNDLNKVTKNAKNTETLTEEEESDYINIELKDENTLPENPVFIKDKSFHRKIYEDNAWARQYSSIHNSAEKKIAELYVHKTDQDFKKIIEEIKKNW